MHSGLLHYWTSAWLFSFSAPIKTDDSHFEAVVAGGRGKEEAEGWAQKLFFQQDEEHKPCRGVWISSVNMCLHKAMRKKDVVIHFFRGCFSKVKVTVQVLSNIKNECFNSLNQQQQQQKNLVDGETVVAGGEMYLFSVSCEITKISDP